MPHQASIHDYVLHSISLSDGKNEVLALLMNVIPDPHTKKAVQAFKKLMVMSNATAMLHSASDA